MYFAIWSGKKILSAIAVVLTIILTSLALYKTGASAVFGGSNLRQLPIYRVQTEEKKLSISFDCAWVTDYTDKLLEIMEKVIESSDKKQELTLESYCEMPRISPII